MISCDLKADGVDVHLRFEPAKSKQAIIGVVEMIVTVVTAAPPIRSIEFVITPADLAVMASYIENHIAALVVNPQHQSGVLINYGSGFQLEGHAGDIRADNDGEFTMTLLLNVGSTSSEARVYAGTRCTVSVVAARRFVAEIRTCSDLASEVAS
jgi:hypothetical protein